MAWQSLLYVFVLSESLVIAQLHSLECISYMNCVFLLNMFAVKLSWLVMVKSRRELLQWKLSPVFVSCHPCPRISHKTVLGIGAVLSVSKFHYGKWIHSETNLSIYVVLNLKFKGNLISFTILMKPLTYTESWHTCGMTAQGKWAEWL